MHNLPANISEWLCELGLEEHVDAFVSNHINFDVLPLLSEQELTALGVTSIGQRLRLQQAIQSLPPDFVSIPPEPANPQSPAASAANENSWNDQVSNTSTRRQLTVLYLDLVGSTTLSQQLDPEDYGDLIGQFRKRCSYKVIRYGGYIAQFMGDGILAYFGYPVAQENAVVHAITSAMEVVSEVHGSKVGEQTIILRAGIATGFALAGDHEKARISGDVNIYGEVPNLAARIQDMAVPGTLLVSELTQSLAAGAFEFTQLPPTPLRGFSDSVSLWQATSPATATGQDEFPDYVSERSKFFNRSVEIKTLKQCWEAMPSNTANIVAVSGEAGIGKSSLLRQITQYITDEGHRVFSVGGSSLHVNTAFHPLTAFVNRVAKPHDSPLTQEILCSYLQQMGITTADIVEPLLRITGLKENTDKQEEETDPVKQRELTKTALLEFLFRLSTSQFTTRSRFLLLFEDLHWWDASSLEVLKEFLSELDRSGILVVITYRHEFEESWIDEVELQKLKLDQLKPARIEQIVKSTANEVTLDNHIIDKIIGRAGGNPLFAEELTKSMAELSRDSASLGGTQSAVVQQVPNSLQDSLMARLDRLSAYKETAQISAIIGREFNFEELQHVAGTGESELLTALSRLVQAELLTSSEQDGSMQYRFTHVLLQDAAYNSVPKRNRRLWHGRLAIFLENQSPSARTTEPDILAHHHFGAGNTRTAVELWHIAGTQAMMQSANREAAGHYRLALMALEAPQSNASEKDKISSAYATNMKISLLGDLGNVLTASEGYAAHETGMAYRQAWELIKNKGNSTAKFSILYGLWNYNLVGAKTRMALENAEEFHAMASTDRDSMALMAAHCMLGQNLAMLGRFSEAHKHLQKAQSNSTRERRLQAIADYGEEPTLISMSFDAWMMWHFGEFERGATLSHRATGIARDFGHINSTALALTFDGILNLMLRFPETALQRAEEVLTLTDDQDLAYWEAEAIIIKGKSLLELGDTKKGVSAMEKGLRAWKKTGAQEHFVPSHASFLAAGYLKDDRPEDALQQLNEALDIVARTEERWFLAELHRIKSECLIQLKYDNATIEAEYQKAVSVAKQQTSNSQLIRILNSYYEYRPQQAPIFLEGLRQIEEVEDVDNDKNTALQPHASKESAATNTKTINLKTIENLIAAHPPSTIYPDIIDARRLWSKAAASS